MISLKSKREIEIIREASEMLKEVFVVAKAAIRAGVTTAEIDSLAEETIRKAGGEPAFKGYRGFPGTICASVNEEVVHGIPGDRELQNGDIFTIDVGAKVNGYFADAARSWLIGPQDDEKQRLIDAAEGGFKAGLAAYRPGCRIGDLSEAIQKHIEERGYQVVRDFVGHGIGRQIHEDPQVPNFGRRGHGPRIQEGLVIAIEPMVTMGHFAVQTMSDGWTVKTKDRELSSHYEDTIAFVDGGYINLTGGKTSDTQASVA